jgi:drug/metabolite transporter (DMT)-like permease
MLLTIIMWGCSFVASKVALRELSPVTMIFCRFALGTVLLLATVGLGGSKLLPPRDSWPALALMGFVGIFVHHMVQAYALTLTDAVHAGWLTGLIPIWSALLSIVLLKERFGGMKLAGLVGGFAGAVLVISRGRTGPGTFQLPGTRGDFLFLFSTLNWAIYTVIGHGTLKRLGATRATAGAMLFGWLMIAPFFVHECGWRELPHLSRTGWGALLFLGIACSGLGYLLYYQALERIEVSRVAAFFYIQPLVTLLAAAILLHEPIRPVTVAGGLLVLVSVFITQRAPR